MVAGALVLAPLLLLCCGTNAVQLGVGKSDVTGIIAQTTMVGFADGEQVAAGLHTRLWARAFVALDDSAAGSQQRFAFVSADVGMPAQAVRMEVARRLGEQYPDGRYSVRNIGFSATHAHAGPSGYFQYMLFDVMSLGFVNQTFEAITGGIVDAIVQAEESLAPGTLSLGTARVEDGGYNRSPTSYLLNPEEERAQYDSDHDDEMVVLKLAQRDSGGGDAREVGMFSWFPVHPTNMNRSNTLISADNKGLASVLFERWGAEQQGQTTPRSSNRSTAAGPPFVAAFAQAHQGDISPNVGQADEQPGALCIDGPNVGLPCEPFSSTCPDENGEPTVALCIARGPGPDGEIFSSTRIMAQRQFDAALLAYGASTELPPDQGDSVSYVHQFVDMSDIEIPGVGRTCKAAMGYSFAAGTTDGPGVEAIAQRGQGMTEGVPLWDLIRDVLVLLVASSPPTAADYECHSPKPVLLPTGWMDVPYAWHPSIVDIQLLRVGGLVLVMAPAEFTTMAGRRLRARVEEALRANGLAQPKVVIAGVSNVYTHYVVTPEEYEAQRYEAASTLFGKHTLSAYIQQFVGLVPALLDGTPVEPGPAPPDLLPLSWVTLEPPPPDWLPSGAEFGTVITEPAQEFVIGAGYGGATRARQPPPPRPGTAAANTAGHSMPLDRQFARASFYGANPRNDMRLGGTFLRVEKFVAGGGWEPVADDDDDLTRMKWNLVDWARGTEDREPSAGFRHKHEQFMAMMLESVESVTGRRIDVRTVARCLRVHGGITGVGRFRNSTSGAPDPSANCTLDDVAPRTLNSTTGTRTGGTAQPQRRQGEYSKVEIEFEMTEATESGEYRLVYAGDRLPAVGAEPIAFEGASRSFTVVNCVLNPELPRCVGVN